VRKFEPVEIHEEQPDPALARAANAAAVQALALGLKTLSQRAIGGMRAAFTAGAIFWVWTATPDPKPSQIVSMTIFALVMLAANIIVRRI